MSRAGTHLGRALLLVILGLPAAAVAAPPPLIDLDGTLYAEGVEGAEIPETPWWESFGSEELNAYMREGLGDNFEALAAWSRIQQAEGLAMQTFAPLLPSATVDVSANAQPTEAVGFQFGGIGPTGGGAPGQPVDTPDVFWTGSALVNANWQVDVWGQQFLSWQASRFDVRASEGDFEATLVALSSRIAEAWLDVVAANNRLDVLATQLEAQEALLELVQLRYERGVGNATEVLQQREQVAAIRSQIPTARIVQRTRAQQLAVLLGRMPGSTPVDTEVLPEPEPLPPTGVPADLVENRPDVRAAYQRVRAAHARKVSSIRALLPSVRLTGQAGRQAVVFDEFQDQSTWGVGGVVSVPVFQGGRLMGAIKSSRANEDISVYQYNQSLLTAVSEVENALVLEQERVDQVAAVQAQVEAAEAAWLDARDRYIAGLDSYLTVLAAWNATQQAELALVQARRDLLGARVQLYDALGGPWTGSLVFGVQP